MKAGILTTEFWAGPVGTTVLNILNSTLGLGFDPATLMQLNGWAIIAYIVARALVKAADHWGAKPSG